MGLARRNWFSRTTWSLAAIALYRLPARSPMQNGPIIFCGTTKEITSEELKKKIKLKEDFQLIDVRELGEYQIKNIGATLIPLGELADNLDKINSEKEIIVHCASGTRSKKAVNLLREKGFTKVYTFKFQIQ